MSLFKILYHCCCHEEKETVNRFYNHEGNAEKDSLKVQEERSDMATPSSFYLDGENSGRKLRIKVIQSTQMALGSIFDIELFGQALLKKGTLDREWCFGSKIIKNGEVKYDFVTKEEQSKIEVASFVIRYIADLNKCFISDLGYGTGTFVKISSEVKLRDGFILSLGISVMTVCCSTEINLLIKILDGPNSGETFSFIPENQPILIGRAPPCHILLSDHSISRSQCKISYHPKKGWTISDGKTHKNSTNGTWLFLESNFEIHNKMIFKSGQTLFEAHFL